MRGRVAPSLLCADGMSGCAFGPYVQIYDPPVDCAITVIARASDGPAPYAWVYRGNVEVDVTGAVEDLGDVELDTGYYETDCSGNVIAENHIPELYKRYRFKLVGAQVGEQLWVNWLGSGIVQPATGMCPADAPLPEPSCTGSHYGCGGDDFPPPRDEVYEHERHYPFACDAGGSPAWLVGVGVALALARKQKRRSR